MNNEKNERQQPMVDVFLMGTAGRASDPNRSLWREPVKAVCAAHGLKCYDPIVPVWNESSLKQEIEAMATARVIVMAITAETPGFGALAESGWAALSASQRKQAFGLYVAPIYQDPKATTAHTIRRVIDGLLGKAPVFDPETIEGASRRARKLVLGHARMLSQQFPNLALHVAGDLPGLTTWIVSTAQKMGEARRVAVRR
jgi:hypothetical protein